jgi:hypothetical protein
LTLTTDFLLAKHPLFEQLIFADERFRGKEDGFGFGVPAIEN